LGEASRTILVRGASAVCGAKAEVLLLSNRNVLDVGNSLVIRYSDVNVLRALKLLQENKLGEYCEAMPLSTQTAMEGAAG